MPPTHSPQVHAHVVNFRRGFVALAVLWPAIVFGQTAVSTIAAFSGSAVSATPVRGPDGALYGTTSAATLVTGGLIFRAEADGSGIRTIYQLKLSDGSSPIGGLVLGSDGLLYGTTRTGSASEFASTGTVFRIAPNGTGFTVLHRFANFTSTNTAGDPINTDGANPEAALVAASDGYLYGVTRAGGPNGTGTVFKIRRNGTDFRVLHTFGAITSATGAAALANADGVAPIGRLLVGADTFLYGTTSGGGANGSGTLFRLGSDGVSFETLRVLPALVTENAIARNADGAFPLAGLTDGGDGKYYGVASTGGSEGNGTVFAYDPVTLVFSVLHNLAGADGIRPAGELLLGQDGKLYGTTVSGGLTSAGGVSTAGTIFEFDLAKPSNRFTRLHSFDGEEGAAPTSGLVQLDGSNFAGVTTDAGSCGQGTLYQFSLTGDSVDGVRNCGQKNRNDGGGGLASGSLLLIGMLGLWRRLAMR